MLKKIKKTFKDTVNWAKEKIYGHKWIEHTMKEEKGWTICKYCGFECPF